MQKLKVDEWLVSILQSMYKKVRSRVRVDDEYSNSFDVRVGVHQGSVLSRLHFVIVLKALQHRTSCFAETAQLFGLEVNLKKTEVLHQPALQEKYRLPHNTIGKTV